MGFAQVNGVSLRYDWRPAEGGPAVVLVHEMGGALESWDGVVALLGERFPLLRHDMRGFGLSEKPRGPVRFSDHADDLVALLDHVGITGPAVVAGCAVGGGVALETAVRHPARVAGVIGFAPATGIPPERRGGIAALAARLEREGMRDFILNDTAVKAWPAELAKEPEAFARFLGVQLASDPVALGQTYAMLADSDLESRLEAVTCSALMVSGRLDAARPRAVVEAVAKRMARGAYREIESSHFMAIQTPGLVADIIAEFAGNLSRR
jgi:3-oxoadipate enol-lactonase